jgi:hypothetical protein
MAEEGSENLPHHAARLLALLAETGEILVGKAASGAVETLAKGGLVTASNSVHGRLLISITDLGRNVHARRRAALKYIPKNPGTGRYRPKNKHQSTTDDE